MIMLGELDVVSAFHEKKHTGFENSECQKKPAPRPRGAPTPILLEQARPDRQTNPKDTQQRTFPVGDNVVVDMHVALLALGAFGVPKKEPK
jgi:hypothetical protein